MTFKGIPLNIKRFYFTGQVFEPRDLEKIDTFYDEQGNLICSKSAFKFNNYILSDDILYYVKSKDYLRNTDAYFKNVEIVHQEDGSNYAIIETNIKQSMPSLNVKNTISTKAIIFDPGGGASMGTSDNWVNVFGNLVYQGKCLIDKDENLILSNDPYPCNYIVYCDDEIIECDSNKGTDIYQMENNKQTLTRTINKKYYLHKTYYCTGVDYRLNEDGHRCLHILDLDGNTIPELNDEMIDEIISNAQDDSFRPLVGDTNYKILHDYKPIDHIVRTKINNDVKMEYINTKSGDHYHNEKTVYENIESIYGSTSKTETSGEYAGYNVIINTNKSGDEIWYIVGSKPSVPDIPSPPAPDIPQP